jgi:excisionase family DNA binding protein
VCYKRVRKPLKVAETPWHWGNLRYPAEVTEPVKWIGTPEACARLGVTLRTLYRFIDEGQLPAYKMGRVIRLQAQEVDDFIERTRIRPGTLEHLYPDPKPAQGRPGLDPQAAGETPTGGSVKLAPDLEAGADPDFGRDAQIGAGTDVGTGADFGTGRQFGSRTDEGEM